MALEHLKKQVKDCQMNLNCQHFQMKEQFLQRHRNLRRMYGPQTENSYNITQARWSMRGKETIEGKIQGHERFCIPGY